MRYLTVKQVIEGKHHLKICSNTPFCVCTPRRHFMIKLLFSFSFYWQRDNGHSDTISNLWKLKHHIPRSTVSAISKWIGVAVAQAQSRSTGNKIPVLHSNNLFNMFSCRCPEKLYQISRTSTNNNLSLSLFLKLICNMILYMFIKFSFIAHVCTL